jgi:hypothetical protein
MPHRFTRAALLGVVLSAACPGQSEERPMPKLRSLRMEQIQAEFFAAQRAHDEWVGREFAACRARHDSVAARNVCFQRLQEEVDRRACAIYERFDEQQASMLGRQSVMATAMSVCRRVARGAE